MEMKRVHIEWKGANAGLNQNYSNGLQYAWVAANEVDGKLIKKQATEFVYCKDYLHDAYWSFANDLAEVSVYGFKYGKKSIPLSWDRLRMLITNSDDSNFEKTIEKSMDFVRQLETAMGFDLAEIFRCFNPPVGFKECGVYYVTASKEWLMAPPMISLFALAIRAGVVHEIGTPFTETIDKFIKGNAGLVTAQDHADAGYWRNAKEAVLFLIEKGPRNIFHENYKENYPKQFGGGYTLHTGGGIVAYARKSVRTYVPYWFREELMMSATVTTSEEPIDDDGDYSDEDDD